LSLDKTRENKCVYYRVICKYNSSLTPNLLMFNFCLISILEELLVVLSMAHSHTEDLILLK